MYACWFMHMHSHVVGAPRGAQELFFPPRPCILQHHLPLIKVPPACWRSLLLPTVRGYLIATVRGAWWVFDPPSRGTRAGTVSERPSRAHSPGYWLW